MSGVDRTELENLRRWKAEAMQVLAEWERVWEALGQPGPLGASKAANVLAALNVQPVDPCFCRAVPNIGGGGCGKPGCPRGLRRDQP